MGKRILLFILTNLLVIATVSIVSTILGLHGYLTRYGLNYTHLAVFCLLWGMGGAFISLLISKFIAKIAMRIRIIPETTTVGHEHMLVQTVHRLAKKAGLTTMPEVGIYKSPELNAFATGPSKRNALVAISSGLIDSMNPDELEGVIGHEVSHIANGDMVTMMLIQGVVNAFAMFLSRIVAYIISIALTTGDREDALGVAPGTFYILSFIFDILFTLLGSILTSAFSRRREFRADRGGAEVAGKDHMIAALERLRFGADIEDGRVPSMAALKISQKPKVFFWFSSHPPLEARIERLKAL